MVDTENDIDIYVEDGILFLIAQKELTINLEMATSIVEKRLKVCSGNSYPTVLDYGDLKYVSPKARRYFSKEGVEGVLAAAFCTKNIATRLFLNSYLMIHKPAIPTKLFSNRTAAVRWLKELMQ